MFIEAGYQQPNLPKLSHDETQGLEGFQITSSVVVVKLKFVFLKVKWHSYVKRVCVGIRRREREREERGRGGEGKKEGGRARCSK